MNSDQDEYISKLRKHVAKQLNRETISDKLVISMLKIAQSSSSVDAFIGACSTFGSFDSQFLNDFYYNQRNANKSIPETVKKEPEIIVKAENSSETGVKDEKSSIKFRPTKPRPSIPVKYEDEEQISVKIESKDDKKSDKINPISHKRIRSDLSSLSDSARDRLAEIRRKRSAMSTDSSIPTKQARNNEYSRKDRYISTSNKFRRDNHEVSSKNFRENPVQDAESERFLDREWYTSEEVDGTAGDTEHNPFYDHSYDAEGERKMEDKFRTRITARAAQKKREHEAWEHNRLRTSGAVGNSQVETDFNEDQESRVHVFIHNITPPFLEGKQIFTRLKDPVSAVRDPQSTLAKYAKKGSSIVHERRKMRERQRQARESASLAGTALGNVLGVQEDDSVVAKDEEPSTESNTEKPSEFSRLKSLKEQRESLPAFAVRSELLKMIRDNQVIVVIGETGSGKTTQITQFLYEEGYADHGMIGCTQPRRVAAMSVARRVSEEMSVNLGDEVGYAIRFEDRTNSKTRIKYMTEGVLLRESLVDPNLDKYSCIIMDEAHERALNTDVLMGLFKNILARRKDIKLIVTSATLNAERFSRFYGGTPQFTIPGRTFPVEVFNSQAPVEDYVDAAVKQVLSVHLQSGPGDILVFMTGQEDIDATCVLIREKMLLLDDPQPLEILPIYSQMPADLQAKIFEPAPKGMRKVVVATNIAETSLTVDGIAYVIDSGYAKLKVYNPKMGMDSLQMVPISCANANQRSGRAGRTGKGVAYRLYTERAEKEEMYEQTIPEIQRTNLSNTLLLLKSLGVDDLLQFDFMDPPPRETITSSLYDLWALGALDNVGKLTSLGSQMALFPMDPSLSKLVIMSMKYGCTEEMITIVSMLSVPTVFYRPKERQEESDAAREKFFVPESDHLTLLHVYNSWKSNGYSDNWCVKHFLHARSLARAREVRDQLLTILESGKYRSIQSCHGNWDIIRKCICSGYFHQAAKVRGLVDYVNLRTSITMQLHPTSALYGLGYLPEYVVYHELVLTSKQFMSCVTAADPFWLSEIGGVFYSVEERGENGQIVRRDHRHEELKKEVEEDGKIYREMMEKRRGTGKSLVKKTAVVLPGGRRGRRSMGL